jgi:tRNA 2-thiouridine synthesizing protein B
MTSAVGPLHTVNKSPFADNALESCLAHLTEGAALLLMEDGVYAALATGTFAARLAPVAAKCAVYALGPDLAARGLADRPLIDGLRIVDYEGFVDLAARHSVVQAWL